MLDATTDFAFIDGLTSADLSYRDGSQSATVDVLRRWVTTSEAAASDGRYTTDDVVFHLSGTGLATEPRPGDSVTEDSNVWTVLTVREEQITDRRELVARRLQTFDTTITIQVATWVKSEDGMQEATWADEITDLPAVVQPIAEADIEEHKRRDLKAKLVAYLSQSRDLTNRRIIHDGHIYRVTGTSHANSIDRLFMVTLEDWPA